MQPPTPQVEAGTRALPRRLRRTAEIYLSQIRPDGGWGLSPGQASSLVNTAEVLTVLEAGGIPYEHEGVQRGLGYLSANLEPHLLDADRGPRTRYVAFVLLGLIEYPQARTRPDVAGCIEFARDWLANNNQTEGGWSSEAGQPALSLFATCMSISALARSGPDHPTIAEGVQCLSEFSLSASTWPLAVGFPQPSPAVTGLAALALFDAGQPAAAKKASRWLSARSGQWSNRTEDARDELGTPWRHMSFGICARAVLRSGIPLYDPELRPTLLHLDSLWSQREGMWSDGAPEGHLTVRGAYAAALLYQELRQSMLTIDPLSLAEALQPDSAPVAETHLAQARVSGPEIILIESIHDKSYQVTLEEVLCALVGELLKDGPVPPRDLSRRLKVRPPDINSMVAEINVKVWSQTEGVIDRFIVKQVGGLHILGKTR